MSALSRECHVDNENTEFPISSMKSFRKMAEIFQQCFIAVIHTAQSLALEL